MGKVRSNIDLGRLSAAASRPGIDPRQWIVRAVVKDIAYDPNCGLFADVQYANDGEIETVLVAAAYAGNDFGQYWPIKVDDIVLVALPNGDPGAGGAIFARLWTGSEKPPKELSENDAGVDGSDPTSDPTTRIEDGTTLRVVGKQGANVKIELDGNATYEIAATGGSKVIIAASASVEVTGTSSVTIDSDVRIKLGASAVKGVARLADDVNAKGLPPAPIPDGTPLVPMIAWASAVTTALGALTAGAFVAVLDPAIGLIASSSAKVSSE